MRTDGGIGMTMLMVAFHNFANGPKNDKQKHGKRAEYFGFMMVNANWFFIALW